MANRARAESPATAREGVQEDSRGWVRQQPSSATCPPLAPKSYDSRMSDEKLRELERRWKESGAVEDEAAFLVALVRSGELSPSSLLLAAVLGSEAAAEAAEASLLSEPAGDLRERVVLAALETDSPREALLRIALGIATYELAWSNSQRYIRTHHKPELKAAAAAMAAARAWLNSPSSPGAQRAEEASGAVSMTAPFVDSSRALGQIINASTLAGPRPSAQSAALVSCSPLVHGSPTEALAVVRAEVVPWLLPQVSDSPEE